MIFISTNSYKEHSLAVDKFLIPKIALSSRFSLEAQNLIRFAKEHDFDGIEYSIQSETSTSLRAEIKNMESLARSGLEIRYHMPFKKIELAHNDLEHTQESVKHFKECLDVIHHLDGRFVITHLCLGYRLALDKMKYEHAAKFLGQIVNYAAQKNISVCLENLTFGFTNTPSVFLDLLKSTGACATVDIGHLVSSPVVTEGIITASDYITELAPYIVTAHVYDKEVYDKATNKAVHIAPQDKETMMIRLKKLLQSNCNWWLIELGDADEILRTASFARAAYAGANI